MLTCREWNQQGGGYFHRFSKQVGIFLDFHEYNDLL